MNIEIVYLPESLVEYLKDKTTSLSDLTDETKLSTILSVHDFYFYQALQNEVGLIFNRGVLADLLNERPNEVVSVAPNQNLIRTKVTARDAIKDAYYGHRVRGTVVVDHKENDRSEPTEGFSYYGKTYFIMEECNHKVDGPECISPERDVADWLGEKLLNDFPEVNKSSDGRDIIARFVSLYM